MRQLFRPPQSFAEIDPGDADDPLSGVAPALRGLAVKHRWDSLD